MRFIQIFAMGLSGMIIGAVSCVAAETDFPIRPVRVVVPFAPSGSTDMLIRIVGEKLGEIIGQTIVVDNRGGAGGRIGAELAAKAPADGYTIMATTSGVIVVNKSLYEKLNYDPIKDFSPVSIIASLSSVLVVHPKFPVNDVKGLLAIAKAKPGTLTYGSGGIGTSNHLGGEMFKYLAGVDLIHVPYKGGGPAVVATVSGEVSMLFATVPTVIQHIKAGRLKSLAVTTRKRSVLLPELPTMIEAGVRDFELAIWIGVLAPKGTPAARIAKINDGIRLAVKSNEVGAQLRAQAYDPVGDTPAEMALVIKEDTERWARVIQKAGIRAQ